MVFVMVVVDVVRLEIRVNIGSFQTYSLRTYTVELV
jgi:hypothetical protein